MKTYLVSLGCPKNLTDSEVLMGKLVAAGQEIINDPAPAETIIINTCAFTQSARDEVMAVIKEMAAWKKKGRCRQLLLAGCYPKWDKKLAGNKMLARVDGILDTLGLFNCCTPRIKATPSWYAYVKIAEGCNNLCSYCLIPQIRGRLKVRKVADILNEVKILAKRGVKEIIYVAQDTTAHPHFADLLRKTANIRGIKWIRVLYAHPAHLTPEIVEVIASERKIVKYLDLPIQHACDKILCSMNRPDLSGSDLENLFVSLRRRIPNLALRTSVIVGFPGESEAEFEALLNFIGKVKFEKLGAFPYYREKGTPAFIMRGQVPEKVKLERLNRLLRFQAKISKEINQKMIGNIIETIIERAKDGQYIGRAYFDAPEIDGQVYVKSAKCLKPGEIVKVQVTGARRYDLIGCMT